MWIMFTNGFVSLVQHGTERNVLLVRARRRGDIERIFGESIRISVDHRRDYLYRTTMARSTAAAALFDQIRHIDYTTFKAAVGDEKLQLAYMRVWREMAKLQTN